ncbi:hypothetical protein KMAL_19600 [Novacetimonas maltaceti]|uniref:Uncharacterized protein n=1 Tax=Novacetimonas maltaceti TaxID=1203393 RepID=A0A2S3W0L3_9PROT|nr:hypothetical protein KMAL_19600 [Novacetimonas maltaceti]
MKESLGALPFFRKAALYEAFSIRIFTQNSFMISFYGELFIPNGSGLAQGHVGDDQRIGMFRDPDPL